MNKKEKEEMEEMEALRNHNVGISVGLDRASQLLMDASVHNFVKGMDTVASILREHATTLKSASDKAHPGPPK